MQDGYEKNRDRFSTNFSLSEMIQDRTIVTMERKWELVCHLSNGTVSNDLE